MRHLVGRHVDRGERFGVVVAVAVGHAEADVPPVGVGVARAVVDVAGRGDAVVADSVAALDVLVVVPGELRAVGGVDTGGLRVVGLARAPDVVGVGEQGAGGAVVLGVLQVVGPVSAAGAVGQAVGAAGRGGAEGDVAGVLAVAGTVLDVLEVEEVGTGGGVGDDVQLGRGPVALHAADDALPGPHRPTGGGPHDLADGGDGRGGHSLGPGALQSAGVGRPGGDARQGGGDGEGGAGGPVDALDGSVGGRMHHQVAAEDRESGEGAVVPGVQRAVRVLADGLRLQLLLGTEAEGFGGGRAAGPGVGRQRGLLLPVQRRGRGARPGGGNAGDARAGADAPGGGHGGAGGDRSGRGGTGRQHGGDEGDAERERERSGGPAGVRCQGNSSGGGRRRARPRGPDASDDVVRSPSGRRRTGNCRSPLTTWWVRQAR